MSEISISKGDKNFGFNQILSNFNFEASKNERIGLIGPNGSGKTTIFKIIKGIETLDTGSLSIRKNATIGLLLQIPPNYPNETVVKDILYQPFKELLNLENQLNAAAKKLEDTAIENYQQNVDRYGRLQDKFIQLEGYEIENKIKMIANGFNIYRFIDRKYNTLSGGEKTLVNLAALMIEQPDILLLDEPTNHLDIKTLEWFEQFLISYQGVVIVSSHDRFFLDKVVNKIYLIYRGTSDIYFGNYSYYIEENQRRIDSEFEQYKNQQKLVEKMEEQIKQLRRFGDEGGGEKFYRRAINIEKRLAKLDLLDKPEITKSLPLDFNIKSRSGKEVLKIENLDLIIGDKILLDNANATLRFKEKVALMGNNGTGKTTLIKLILENNNPNITIGSSVSIGYLPQEIFFKDDNLSILETARQSFGGHEHILRSTLSKFLFYGENVFKRVSSLSGGEKVRLKLLELINLKPNLLILDEPTNHIDIDTREVLEEALSEFQGTVLFISHDRYFINQLATKIIYIEDFQLHSYNGNYNYYLDLKQKPQIVKTKKKKPKEYFNKFE